MINVALVGKGYLGSKLERYIRENQNLGLISVCDSKSDLHREIYENPTIDAVIVATPYSNRNLFKEVIVYYSIVGLGSASVLFSLYLAYIQKFVLRKWCYYCIISTIAPLLIFVVIIYG